MVTMLDMYIQKGQKTDSVKVHSTESAVNEEWNLMNTEKNMVTAHCLLHVMGIVMCIPGDTWFFCLFLFSSWRRITLQT